MGEVISMDAKKDKLKDAVAAFTFSRLPREQRIAQIMYGILSHETTGLENDSIHDNGAIVLKITDSEGLIELASMLEPYALKDFAVRYGHLGDGVAKA